MLEIEVAFAAQGRKSSEGDGRTAADIEREIEEQRRRVLQEQSGEQSPEKTEEVG